MRPLLVSSAAKREKEGRLNEMEGNETAKRMGENGIVNEKWKREVEIKEEKIERAASHKPSLTRTHSKDKLLTLGDHETADDQVCIYKPVTSFRGQWSLYVRPAATTSVTRDPLHSQGFRFSFYELVKGPAMAVIRKDESESVKKIEEIVAGANTSPVAGFSLWAEESPSVIERGPKNITLRIRGKPAKVSVDRVKPAYALPDPGRSSVDHDPPATSTASTDLQSGPAGKRGYLIRAGRLVHPRVHFN
ncbi:hypothetical protein J437_LFUL010640 [Ladona fulva]|uniref:Uncharacterized protein n=1 Tax=Ladona fulva TaxID=123851 RepID=A0A8K0KT16_LADFU|nr:hypothetical protein J437_LFUL010640 [Ladona fulva]